MARRLAAVSALVFAALALSPAARAQGFFSFPEASPRDVLSRLDEEGYAARLPMTRHGDVYIVDARSSSGRWVRLIVSARDGDILERYAATPRSEDYGRARFSDEDPGFRRHDDQPVERPERRLPSAFDDSSDPRALNFDGGDRLAPPGAIPDPAAPARPRRHGVKKPAAPTVAKDAPEPAMADVAPSDPKPSPPRVIDVPPAKLVTAPAKPEPKPPATQANVEAPRSATPRIVGESTSTAMPKFEDKKPEDKKPEDKKVEDKKAPKAVPLEARAEDKPRIETKPAPKPEPKPEAPRKKLNDLPVGTLD